LFHARNAHHSFELAASGMVNQASSYKLLDAVNSNTIERFLQHAAGDQKKPHRRGGFEAVFPL